MFKELAGLGSLFKQAQQIGGRMEVLKERLKTERVTGSAGGGMVEVRMDGLGQCLSVKLDPMLVERNEREMLEDLIPAAVNQASEKARQLHAEAMQSLTEGMNLPGLGEALTKFTGNGPD